jgi:hypothetical protein
LLDDLDRLVEVPSILLQLRQSQPDGVAIDRQLGRDALRDRELEPGEEVGRDATRTACDF